MSDAFDPPARDDAGPDREGRPKALTVVAVLAIALGALGLFGTLTGVFGLVSTYAGLGLDQLPPGQRAAQEDLIAASLPFLPFTALLVLATAALAAMLLLGGVSVFAEKAGGAPLLRRAFQVGLVVEPLRFLVALVQSLVTLPYTRAMMEGTAPASLPPEMEGMMGGIVAASLIIGLVLGAAWMVAKIAYYVVGLRVLKRPDVEAHVAALGG